MTEPVSNASELPPIDGVPFDKLALVHVTRFPPQRNMNGQIVIQSAFDGNGALKDPITQENWRGAKRSLRNTVHFTLNGVVSDHELGNWGHVPFVIVAPLKSSIEANGAPQNLNTVDTFWSTAVGQDIVLPGAIVVGPNPDTNDGALVRVQGNKVLYCAQLTADHAAELQKVLGERECISRLAQNDLTQLSEVVRLLRNHSVETVALKSLGAPTRTAGKYAWDDSHSVSQDTECLATALGSHSSQHMGSAWDNVENCLGQGNVTSAFGHAALADDKTVSFVRSIGASPHYPILADYIVAHRHMNEALHHSSNWTVNYDGLKIDQTVRARTAEALGAFQKMLGTLAISDIGENRALDQLMIRQQAAVENEIKAARQRQDSSVVAIDALSRPLAMMQAARAGIFPEIPPASSEVILATPHVAPTNEDLPDDEPEPVMPKSTKALKQPRIRPR